MLWILSITLILLARRWLRSRAEKLYGSHPATSSFAIWCQCLWGWAWRSFLIFVIPIAAVACAFGGNDPARWAQAIALVLAGWLLTLPFILDAPCWPLRKRSQGLAYSIPDAVFAQIAEELRTGTYDQALWLKSLTQAGGDQGRAVALYSTERARSLGQHGLGKDTGSTSPPWPLTASLAAVLAFVALFLVVALLSQRFGGNFSLLGQASPNPPSKGSITTDGVYPLVLTKADRDELALGTIYKDAQGNLRKKISNPSPSVVAKPIPAADVIPDSTNSAPSVLSGTVNPFGDSPTSGDSPIKADEAKPTVAQTGTPPPDVAPKTIPASDVTPSDSYGYPDSPGDVSGKTYQEAKPVGAVLFSDLPASEQTKLLTQAGVPNAPEIFNEMSLARQGNPLLVQNSPEIAEAEVKYGIPVETGPVVDLTKLLEAIRKAEANRNTVAGGEEVSSTPENNRSTSNFDPDAFLKQSIGTPATNAAPVQ